MTHKVGKYQPRSGDVVIVKSDNKNRGIRPLAIVREIYPGRNGDTRAVQLKTVNGVLERPVQYLYPLELTCNIIPRAEPLF